MDTEIKHLREKKLVGEMIVLYCRNNHGSKELCTECSELKSYAEARSDNCPFMENKTFCSNCRVHCYKPEMREKIRRVMRFSGSQMIFQHPIMAVNHVISNRREKNRLEKE